MPLNIIKQVIDIKETEGKLITLLEFDQRYIYCIKLILVCLPLISSTLILLLYGNLNILGRKIIKRVDASPSLKVYT